MKTSWNNLKTIEQYLAGTLTPPQTFLFKVKLLLYPALQLNVALQQKTYVLVKLYARRKMKKELEALHDKIFAQPENQVFKQEILALFSNSNS